MARSRARARSGHGRLGAALRVVAALLRAGEPVPPLVPEVPRSVRAVSAAPASAPPGPQIGARTRDFSPVHTCVPWLAGCLGHLCQGTVFAGAHCITSPRRHRAASVVLVSHSVLTLFTTG